MKDIQSRLFETFTVLVAIALTLALPGASVFAADTYPSRPVRLVIPFAPGGATDLQGRVIAPYLSKRLGQPVIVDNRAGGGSVVGTEMVAKADPDGYTLAYVDSAFNTQPAIQKLPYDPIKSFAPVALISNAETAFVVYPGFPAHSVKEFIAQAKQKPGQVTIATSGMGGGAHFAIAVFQMMANIDLKLLHFKGGGPAMIDVLGGHTDSFLGGLSTSLPNIKSGKLRIIGTCGSRRSAALPDVPTIAEAGVPGFEYNTFRAILAPAGTPKAVIDRLNKELKEILALDEVKKEFESTGADVDYRGPSEYSRILEKEIAMWANVAKKANIKME